MVTTVSSSVVALRGWDSHPIFLNSGVFATKNQPTNPVTKHDPIERSHGFTKVVLQTPRGWTPKIPNQNFGGMWLKPTPQKVATVWRVLLVFLMPWAMLMVQKSGCPVEIDTKNNLIHNCFLTYQQCRMSFIHSPKQELSNSRAS